MSAVPDPGPSTDCLLDRPTVIGLDSELPAPSSPDLPEQYQSEAVAATSDGGSTSEIVVKRRKEKKAVKDGEVDLDKVWDRKC